jgi:hypothetical protein
MGQQPNEGRGVKQKAQVYIKLAIFESLRI